MHELVAISLGSMLLVIVFAIPLVLPLVLILWGARRIVERLGGVDEE